MTNHTKNVALIVVAAAVLGVIGWLTLHETGGEATGEMDGVPGPPDEPSDPVLGPPDFTEDPPTTPAPEPTGFFSVIGSVVTFEGEPAPGVGVGVVRVWPGGTDLYRLPTARTDEAGAFRVEGVPVGGAMLALFPGIPPGLDENEVKLQSVVLTGTLVGPDGGEVNAGVITLEPPASIEGVVLDEEGETCVRAHVVLGTKFAGLGRKRTRTDHEGRFRFKDLPPGEYFLHASARILGLGKGWRSKSIDRVSPGTGDLVIRLTTPSALVLMFHPSEDPRQPLLLRSGRLYPVGGSVAYQFGQATNPKPVVRWSVGLAPGTHHLQFTSEGYRAVDLGDVTIEPERQTVVDVVLSPE